MLTAPGARMTLYFLRRASLAKAPGLPSPVSGSLRGRLIGCPHEEGIDYPEGHSCPHCPYRRSPTASRMNASTNRTRGFLPPGCRGHPIHQRTCRKPDFPGATMGTQKSRPSEECQPFSIRFVFK